MSTGQIYLLGAIAGVTIFVGLPVGRIKNMSKAVAAFMNAAAAGVLVFLLVETVEHAFVPVEEALEAVTVHSGGTWGEFAGKAALFTVALGVGLLGLVYYERWMNSRRSPSRQSVGPGAAAVDEFKPVTGLRRMSDARHLAFLIAVGIGLHNFAEGLAIGQSAANDQISLAALLVIGFAVHNATEGFGIIGPLGDVRPSWRWLALVGVIGGGPTFLGAIVGYNVTSEPLELVFYAVAGGAIFYVIGEIQHGIRRHGHRELGLILLAGGFAAGILTDLVVTYGGG